MWAGSERTRSWRAAIALGVIAALSGCVETRTTGFSGRPMPRAPRAPEPAPATAQTDALVLNVSAAPLDTNGNGRPDLIQASVHLFDQRYPPPIHEAGAIVFAVFAPGETGAPGKKPRRTWRFEGEKLKTCEGRSVFGACYQMPLSLLDDPAGDDLGLTSADIAAKFEPADGREAIYAGEVSQIQLTAR